MEENKIMDLALDVDRLGEVRAEIKKLQDEEKILKEKMIADGRNEIPGTNCKVVISTRTTETFNEEAFIEKFSNDKNFEDNIKNMVLDSKIFVNQSILSDLVSKNEIPLDYVIPFSEIKSSTVVSIK